MNVYKEEGTQLARLYAWLPRLPVACMLGSRVYPFAAGAQVTPLGGGRRLAVTVPS